MSPQASSLVDLAEAEIAMISTPRLIRQTARDRDWPRYVDNCGSGSRKSTPRCQIFTEEPRIEWCVSGYERLGKV